MQHLQARTSSYNVNAIKTYSRQPTYMVWAAVFDDI